MRVDFFTHIKTRKMQPLAYCIVMLALQNSILGCLRLSPRAIASYFDGVSPLDVEAAIAYLEMRGNARWWPNTETLLIVEAFDEQSFNHLTEKSGIAEAATLDDEVQKVLRERYGDRLFVHYGAHNCIHDEPHNGVHCTVSDTDTDSVTDTVERCAKRVLAYLNQSRSEFVAGGLHDTTQIAGRIKDGRTETECRLVVDGLVAQCRKDRKQVEWFDTVTPFRKANFDRALARAQLVVSSSKPTTNMDDLE